MQISDIDFFLKKKKLTFSGSEPESHTCGKNSLECDDLLLLKVRKVRIRNKQTILETR